MKTKDIKKLYEPMSSKSGMSPLERAKVLEALMVSWEKEENDIEDAIEFIMDKIYILSVKPNNNYENQLRDCEFVLEKLLEKK